MTAPRDWLEGRLIELVDLNTARAFNEERIREIDWINTQLDREA